MTELHSAEQIREATDRFHSILEANRYLVLATESCSKPWIAPLYFAFDRETRLYFISRNESEHAQHLRENSSVAVAIFDSAAIPGQCDGIQLRGTARELVSLHDISHAAKILFSRRFSDSESRAQFLDPHLYMHLSDLRLYEIILEEAFVVDTARSNDHRIAVELKK